MNKITDPFTNKEFDFVDPFAEQEDKGGLGKAFGAGVDKLQELGYRAVKGFTDVGNEGDGLIEQDGALSKFAQEGIDRNIEEQKAYEPTVGSYKDVDSIGSAASYVGELVAGSVPYMAGAVTPIGAATMAGGLSQEAYDKQEDKNAIRAVASGSGQMLLERLGIKGSLGQIGKDIMKDGVMSTAKRYGKGEFVDAIKDPKTALEFSKRVLKGSVWEGATEAGQEALAQWGAGADVSQIQGLDEAFVGGFAVGGVMRTSSEGAQKLMSWQSKSAPIAKNGIDELVKQGVTQEDAINQVKTQLIESGIKQGLTEVESAAAAARTLKTEYGIDHEIFTPIANDVASRRSAMNERLNQQRIDGGIGDVQNALKNNDVSPTSDELVLQQMQNNDPAFFEQLNEQEETAAEKAAVQTESEVNNITKTENNLLLDENNSISEKNLQSEPQVIDPFAEEEKLSPQGKGKGKVNTLDVVEAPVGELTLSNDVPQFKSGANEKGVVEPLGGKFDRTGVSPIQVWVRKDGRKEVISGRHRTELAQRSGEQTIPAQYHYEENGFDKYQAAALDAILNIREGQGKVKDYVDFIKHTGLTEAEATEQGILARTTGKRAYTIASQGSDTLIAAHRNNGITDEAAVRISKAAPNDEALQAVGIKAIDDGKTITVAENMVKAVKSFSSDQQQGSGDLFGFDDSAMIEAENLAKAASKKQAEIQRSLSAIQGAAKRPDLAKKEGVNVKNPKAVQKRIEQLKEDKRQWDNWHTNPELVAQLKDKPDIPQEQTPQTTASQEAVSISEPQENSDQAVGMQSLETETSPAIEQEEQSSSAQLKPEPTIDEAAHEAATSPTNNLKEPSDAQKESVTDKAENIEDFGEKLGGARKDTWGGFAEKLNDNTNIKTEPLSKSLPQPDYEKMADEGVNPEHLAFIAIARDSIKAKPRASYKLGSWVKHVENVKSQIKQVLNNEIDTGKAFSALSLTSSYGSMNGAKDAIAIIAKAHPSKLKDVAGYRITSGSYSMFKGVKYNPSKTMFNIEKKGTRFNFDAAVETLEEAQKNLSAIIEAENKATTKKGKHSKVSVYRNRTTGDTYLGWKGASGILKIKSFESTSEARSYLENNRDEVEETLQKMKYTPDMRKPINAEREGPERSADNVTPSIFGDAFGFRGVEFGNWVDQGKRQKDLNQAYDSLMDLAEALDIPPEALSLNGQLGLAFGARGKGGKEPAAAHYEPGTVVINLTKKAGSGSLAHEWWHALDNYFGKKRNKTNYITESPYSLPNEEIRPEMARAFKAVRDAINESDLPDRSSRLDQRKSKAYWATTIEMTARSFESFIIDKLGKSDISNDYLANVVSSEAWEAAESMGFEDGSTYPYPKKSEREKINKAYQTLFDTIEHKKTDDGVALFRLDSPSTVKSDTKASGIPIDKAEAIAKEFMDSYNGNVDISITIKETQEEVYGPEATIEKYGRIKGAYNGKNEAVLGLVSGNLHSSADARETLRHEILGHYGLDTFKKSDRQEILDKIIASQNEPSLKAQWDKIKADKYYSTQSLDKQAEEVFAHTIESGRNSAQRIYDQIIAWLKSALRKVGLNKYPSSTSELRRLAETIGKQIRNGERVKKSSSEDTMLRTENSIQEETTVDFALRKAQDKFRRLKVIQRELSINEDNDTYKAEEAIHGKVKNDIENIETKYVDKIAKLMAKNKLSQNEVDLYAIAKHAEERNAYIDTINPDLNGAGSGMSNEAAQAILDKAIVEEKRLPLEEITNHIYSMLGEAREIMVKFGLEPQDAVDTWQKQYKYYVPLKGYANDEATQAIGSDGKKAKQYKRSGGFNVKGRETIKAMGRRSLAESPLLHAVSDTTRAIIRARTNEVGNTFLKMVEENPDPNLWEVFSDEDPDHRRGEIKKDGETVIGQIPVTAYDMKKDKETYFATKIKGVEKFVKIHDPLLMRAMGNLGVEPMGYLTQAFGNATRFLSALNTTWNVTFAPSNFVRDIQSAIANIVSENQALDGKIKDVDGFAFDMVKFIPQSLAVVRQGTVNKDFSGNGKFNTPELSAYFKEFLESGAKTGWVNQENIDQLGKNLGRAISRESNTKWGATQRGFKHIADFVENYNDIIENGTRFSAYYNARKRGVSVKRASSLAKNLTVNFNRKGEIGNGLNAFYMFANANIQGNANLFRALFSRKNKEANVMDVRSWTLTQQLAVSAIGATVSMSYLMSAIGGDDEDGIPYYDKIPNYIKNTNFIFMTGGVNEKNEPNYITIPMPYGYNILATIGHSIYDSANTDKTKASIASNLVSSMLSAFSPIGMEDSDNALTGLTRTLTPTLAKPLVEIMANENFFGGQIVYGQDGYATKKAGANLGTERTWEWTKNLTSWLNDVTGGGTYRSGAIDITPQHVEHILKFIGGGALQTALRTVDAGTKVAQGKEVDRKDIPLLRKFYKSVDKKAAVGDFYNTYNELKKYQEDYELLRGKDKAEFKEEFGAHLKLYRLGNGLSKSMRNLNKSKKQIEASKLSEIDKKARIAIIEDKKRDLSLRLSIKRQELGVKIL